MLNHTRNDHLYIGESWNYCHEIVVEFVSSTPHCFQALIFLLFSKLLLTREVLVCSLGQRNDICI